MSQKTVEKIKERLEYFFSPFYLEIEDDSHRHAGHAGSKSGLGGHYRVTIGSEKFIGKNLIEQHQSVNELLKDFFGKEVHALQLKTLTHKQK